MQMLDLTIKLSEEALARLRHEADIRHLALDEVVSAVLTDYLDEPQEADILASLRQSMLDVMNGLARPADEVLAELKAELGLDGDKG